MPEDPTESRHDSISHNTPRNVLETLKVFRKDARRRLEEKACLRPLPNVHRVATPQPNKAFFTV